MRSWIDSSPNPPQTRCRRKWPGGYGRLPMSWKYETLWGRGDSSATRSYSQTDGTRIRLRSLPSYEAALSQHAKKSQHPWGTLPAGVLYQSSDGVAAV